MNDNDVTRDTKICGCYRYHLERTWDSTGKKCVFIMLNPSKANGVEDDPTIKKCIKYAKLWGYGSLEVVNLFAYRSTDKSKIKNAGDPIGKENKDYIIKTAKNADLVVAAWGNDGIYKKQSKKVLELLKKEGIQVHCIELTNKKEPSHPLYLRKNLKPEPLRLI